MSKIPSATTLNVHVYMTNTGREYLLGFDPFGRAIRYDYYKNDLLRPTEFSLFDSDVNYRSINKLESGDLPDLSGSGGSDCLNTLENKNNKNRLYF